LFGLITLFGFTSKQDGMCRQKPCLKIKKGLSSLSTPETNREVNGQRCVLFEVFGRKKKSPKSV
jgi:hypothetical protein